MLIFPNHKVMILIKLWNFNKVLLIKEILFMMLKIFLVNHLHSNLAKNLNLQNNKKLNSINKLKSPINPYLTWNHKSKNVHKNQLINVLYQINLFIKSPELNFTLLLWTIMLTETVKEYQESLQQNLLLDWLILMKDFTRIILRRQTGSMVTLLNNNTDLLYLHKLLNLTWPHVQ